MTSLTPNGYVTCYALSQITSIIIKKELFLKYNIIIICQTCSISPAVEDPRTPTHENEGITINCAADGRKYIYR